MDSVFPFLRLNSGTYVVQVCKKRSGREEGDEVEGEGKGKKGSMYCILR